MGDVKTKRPNVIYVFSDQHRAQACGYRGNPDVKTPNMDRLAKESVDFTLAVSGMPVCCPYRASFLTGQYPHHHGVFVNDVCLNSDAVSIAQAFKMGGYDTAYIGKWHVDGHGRSGYIPRERRQGFDYWKVLECTHDYNHSYYYQGDEKEKRLWEGYDAFAQTRAAMEFLADRDKSKPVFLVLSWGPPHDPYDTAPEAFRRMYRQEDIHYRKNVPFESLYMAKSSIPGYYAHVSALDACLGELMDQVERLGMKDDTIFVYTSDHGDMLGSQGTANKQKPWDESIRVPFLLRYPRLFGREGRQVDMPFNSPDIMPTLLSLCSLPIPDTVDGISYGEFLKGEEDLQVESALLQCLHPFGQWHKNVGGREFRGIRTRRYTYVVDLKGPWLLYDNEEDPFQMENLLETGRASKELINSLEQELTRKLNQAGDEFLTGREYLARFGHKTDFIGTVPYQW